MRKLFALAIAAACCCGSLGASAQTVVDMAAEYGIKPDRGKNVSDRVARALADIKSRHAGHAVTLKFAPGRYDFYPKGSISRTYYISNHDQENPKNVGIAIENWDSVTIAGEGAEFMFHGRMLPVAVTGSRGCTLSGFSIDFATPHITQVEIVDNNADGITFRTAPWVKAEVNGKGAFVSKGEGWQMTPMNGIAFEHDTRRLVYRTSDLWCPVDSVIARGKSAFFAPKWHDDRLKPGTVVALRTWGRPAPGVFLDECVSTTLRDVTVHYAEGMGLLAQLCDSVNLEGFKVALRGTDDPRYFTTQADATHFSGCRGLIRSTGGLYEGMMDDAINVHGTYLKLTARQSERTVRARYMHGQSYGFKWGEPGDSVQIISSETMETIDGVYVIESIIPSDTPTTAGCKEFEITFTAPLPAGITETGAYGFENLTWSPEVYFADNVIRNNRARGSLFSTPRRTVVERNLFDHTSGTAVLLCGDCMGWFETGACRDVTIRHNRFVNSLTNMFQFTEAVISIYPEIHNLAAQQKYFHSGIVIEDNEFVTFDAPLLFAKSVDGLRFSGNKIVFNHDYPAFHSNTFNFRLLRTRNVDILDNDFGQISPSVRIE